MAASDLTTLDAVKAWLGDQYSSSTYDSTLTSLITACSRAIYGAISRRSVIATTYGEVYDGLPTSGRIFLRQWPVLSVSSLVIDNVAIQPAAAAPQSVAPIQTWPAYGWLLQPWDGQPPGLPQALDVFGWRCRSGRRQSIYAAYSAGYAVQGEAMTVPSGGGSVTAAQPWGAWAADGGVTYAATGVALSAVTESPAQGQYSVSGGVYTFAAADAAAALLTTYSYIPADLAQACVEFAAARLMASTRIGVRSKSLGGQETVSFDVAAIPATVSAMINPYRRVTMQ